MDLEITYYLLLLFFPLSLIIIFTYTTKYYSFNPYLPPSPPKLPIIGNLHQIGTVPYLAFQTLAETYGPLMLLHFGSVPTVIVSSLELAQEFLRTHDLNFTDRPQSLATEILFRQSCDVAFYKYREYWKQAKKSCVLELLSQKRVQEFRFAREEEISDMVNKINQSGETGGSISVSELLVSVTYNRISRAALGRVYERGDGASELIKLDIFIGGTDNNATTLEWTMAELMKHPEIMKKAQEEVWRVVGSKLSIEEADLDKMEILKCVLKETFRVHGPGIATPRKSLEYIKLENGYEIPARTTTLINTWAIHRDPKVWDRPQDFVPERFFGFSVDMT